jgi:hypothetical protein
MAQTNHACVSRRGSTSICAHLALRSSTQQSAHPASSAPFLLPSSCMAFKLSVWLHSLALPTQLGSSSQRGARAASQQGWRVCWSAWVLHAMDLSLTGQTQPAWQESPRRWLRSTCERLLLTATTCEMSRRPGEPVGAARACVRCRVVRGLCPYACRSVREWVRGCVGTCTIESEKATNCETSRRLCVPTRALRVAMHVSPRPVGEG